PVLLSRVRVNRGPNHGVPVMPLNDLDVRPDSGGQSRTRRHPVEVNPTRLSRSSCRAGPRGRELAPRRFVLSQGDVAVLDNLALAVRFDVNTDNAVGHTQGNVGVTHAALAPVLNLFIRRVRAVLSAVSSHRQDLAVNGQR